MIKIILIILTIIAIVFGFFALCACWVAGESEKRMGYKGDFTKSNDKDA